MVIAPREKPVVEKQCKTINMINKMKIGLLIYSCKTARSCCLKSQEIPKIPETGAIYGKVLA